MHFDSQAKGVIIQRNQKKVVLAAIFGIIKTSDNMDDSYLKPHVILTSFRVSAPSKAVIHEIEDIERLRQAQITKYSTKMCRSTENLHVHVCSP